jgi:transposase
MSNDFIQQVKDNENIIISFDESISIDFGMKNLLAIYDPTGPQHILDGKYLSSNSHYYNNKLTIAKSKNNMVLFNKLQLKHKNIIDDFFDNFV